MEMLVCKASKCLPVVSTHSGDVFVHLKVFFVSNLLIGVNC